MPTIKVFSNKFRDEAEQNIADAGISFRGWLRATVTGYCETHDSRGFYSVTLNGQPLPPDQWDTPLAESDVVCVFIEPKGAPMIIMTIITVITAVATIRAMNSLDVPDTYNNTTPYSSSIYSVNAQANSPRLMAPAPVLFGTHKVMADYLCPSYRAYNAHSEWRHFMLSVCGHPAEVNSIRIGDTPIDELLPDVAYTVFQPGQNVTSHPAHRHLYTVAEVDGNGVEIKGPLPVFTFDPPFIPQQPGYQWAPHSGDARSLVMFAGTVNNEGNGLFAASPVNWRVGFNNAGYTDVSLVGAIISLFIGGTYQYFRVEDDSAPGEISTEGVPAARLQKVIQGTWEIDQTWSGFPGNIGYLPYWSIVNEAGDRGRWAGWFNCCPQGETTDLLEFDFSMPEGIAELDNDGVPRTYSITIEMQYRNGPDGAITSYSETFTESTLNARAYTITRNVAAGAWQARCRVTSISQNKTLTKEKVLWNGLRSELETATSYPFTTVAISIKGTQRLSAVASNRIGVIATGKHPVLQPDLTWSDPVATRSVSAAVGYIAKAAGNTDDQINLQKLYAMGQVLDARGDYFDCVFDTETTAWEALKRALLIGWAQPVVDYGKIDFVRDVKNTDLGWQFSEHNMIPSGNVTVRESIVMPGRVNEKHDGVEVEYIDTTTWKSATKLVTLPGQFGLRPEKLRVYGLAANDDNRATRYGLRHLRQKKYRNRRYEFTTEQDALECLLHDPVQIGWTMPHRSQTGEVRSVTGLRLRLSEPVEFTAGQTHTIIVSDPHGKATGPYVATATIDPSEIEIDRPLEFTPEFSSTVEPPRYQFGPEGRRSISALIHSVRPSGTDKAAVVAVVNDMRVFDDDDHGLA